MDTNKFTEEDIKKFFGDLDHEATVNQDRLSWQEKMRRDIEKIKKFNK
jgi:hypothetical protein